MYACICWGYLLCVSAERSGICVCIDRFILFFVKPRRDFGIAQDIVLGLMPVTVVLLKVHPKEGALVQGSLFLSLLRVMRTHTSASPVVSARGDPRARKDECFQGLNLLLRLFSVCAVGWWSAFISSLLLEPRTNSSLSIH